MDDRTQRIHKVERPAKDPPLSDRDWEREKRLEQIREEFYATFDAIQMLSECDRIPRL
jgi:hypothetical protein